MWGPIFIIGTVVLVIINGLPSMRDSLTNPVHVYEGDDALVTCVVRDIGDNTVMWKKDDRERHSTRVLTAAETRVTGDKRFAVLHDAATKTEEGDVPSGGDVWVLVIKNARPSDSGIYVCEVNSNPIVRSFHKLSVLSRALQPPDNSTETQSTYDSASSAALDIEKLVRNHNYTDCCLAANVSSQCIGFCNIQSILDGNTGQDPESCETDFPAIVRCMADGRNHVPCCQNERIPDLCQDVCRGEYTVITDNIKTHFSCSAYTESTLACIVEGIEILPSAPERVDVDSMTEKSLRIDWTLPTANTETITGYVVNVTSLRSFDAHLIEPVEVPSSTATSKLNDSQQRVHVTIPAGQNSTIVNDLRPFTMYEITVTAVNKHGSSLPSYAVRALTQTPGKMKPTNVGAAPRLPDIKQCCVSRGVTHTSCVDRLCDPVKAVGVDVTDIMICAPWANETFNCLTNGIDHSDCCRARGLPDLCQKLCTGNVTSMDFNYFKCLRYMGEYTNCLLQGYGVLPSAPTQVHLTNIATDYAILHWGTPRTLGDTVTHFKVRVRALDTDYSDGEYAVAEKAQPPFVLEGLHSDTDYEVYVEAVNVHGVGEPSSRIVFKTQSLILEEKIEEASTYNVTACCVAADLSEMCLPLCSYDASMTDVRALAGVCGAEFHKLLRCGAGGRNHGACCSRRGVPVTCLSLCSGIMVDSLLATATRCVPFIGNIVQCFEEGTGKLPGPIRELHATTVTDSDISLEWEPPNDGSNVTGYIVHYQKVDNMTDGSHDTMIKLDNQQNTTNTMITLTNLNKGAVYHIFVVSGNDHGTSLPSSILIVNVTQTDENANIHGVTSPPHSLAVSSHSATWVTITWQPPEFSHPTEQIKYRLYHKSTSEEGFTMVNTTVTSYTLDKLNPNTQYIVYVTSINDKGYQSMPSETLIAWTDPAYPAFVEPPTVHPVNLVMEGNSMTILCIAMGNPMPTISLYISGRLIRQETTRHMVTVVHNVTRDMDQISCYADNGYGTPMQASRKITISHIPHIQPSAVTMATRGSSVRLECWVDAFPEPKMLFWRDPTGRIPVIQGGHYDISVGPSKDEEGKYLMRLRIDNISDHDEGDYFCHAENAFGSETKAVSLRIRNVAASHNVTQCCAEQNVSSQCMDACSFYLDIDAVIEKPECISDFDKLMKCAADGSDHRSCCAQWGVPRRCLDWCRGEPLLNNKLCVLSYTKPIISCFHEGRDKLPGPPQNIHVEVVDTHTVMVHWDPPVKNPHTVELYRVFWRPIGAKNAYKNDTNSTSIRITGLSDDVTYECVIKAGNNLGTSTLTEPTQFSTRDKYITSAASLGGDSSHAGVAVAVVLALLVVGAIVVGAIWFMRTRHMLGVKNSNGVAFENPSYLREVNMDHIQLPQGQAETTTIQSNGSVMNGSISVSQTSGGQGWKQESLHVPSGASTTTATQHEVNPTLYEELKLGSDGAGFKRLKP